MIHRKYLKTQLKAEHFLLPESCGGKVMFDHVTKCTIIHIHRGANQNTKIPWFFLTSLLVLLISVTNILLYVLS